MTHQESILELLDEIAPGAACDDCLSRELNIKPRQQVNHIGHRLAEAMQVSRYTGACQLCSKQKTVNARTVLAFPARAQVPAETVSNAAGPQRDAPNPALFDIERARTDVVHMCHEIWRRHKKGSPPRSISFVITTLREENLLPSHQANMMLTLCGMRNVYVYENLQLGSKETQIG